MKVTGSVIARLGSKRLTYKNLLPFNGKPLIGIAIERLFECNKVDQVVVSTESELIARVALDFGAKILKRPPELAEDNTPSIPVFQHIVANFPCDIHVNFNCNYPLCETAVIDTAIKMAVEKGEALSNPFAVWAQSKERLENYLDPFDIPAIPKFNDDRTGPLDIHCMDDLLETYRLSQGQIDF